MNRNKTSEKIKYLVQRQGGDFIIEVPANWKITFGAVNPSGASSNGRYDLHCVRVWEAEKLRAVFCDVRGFRDLSIPLAMKVQKETGSAEWTMDSNGNFEERRSIEVEHSLQIEDADVRF